LPRRALEDGIFFFLADATGPIPSDGDVYLRRWHSGSTTRLGIHGGPLGTQGAFETVEMRTRWNREIESFSSLCATTARTAIGRARGLRAAEDACFLCSLFFRSQTLLRLWPGTGRRAVWGGGTRYIICYGTYSLLWRVEQAQEQEHTYGRRQLWPLSVRRRRRRREPRHRLVCPPPT
jgi:hypothetical protein